MFQLLRKFFVYSLLADNLLFVDVRGSEEAASGTRFPGSANIPVSDFQSRVDEIGEKTRPIVMHCRSGMRLGRCCDLAKKAGYVNVFSVANAEAGREITDCITKAPHEGDIRTQY